MGLGCEAPDLILISENSRNSPRVQGAYFLTPRWTYRRSEKHSGELTEELRISTLSVMSETSAIFLLLGDGPALTDLQRQVHDDKLDDTVFLLGFRADVRDILCASDIAFHAALGEGFSLSIIEYMSAGLPVLVPNIPSVSQPITHTKSGLIYKHDDPQEAAAYIAQLVNDQSQRLAIGATAKAEAGKKYSLKRCTGTLVATIKQSILSES